MCMDMEERKVRKILSPKKKKVFEVLIRHNRDCFVENRSKNKNGIQNLEKIGKNLENQHHSEFVG